MKKTKNTPKKLELKKINIANLDANEASQINGGQRSPQWWGQSMVGTIWSLPCDRNVSCGVYEI